MALKQETKQAIADALFEAIHAEDVSRGEATGCRACRCSFESVHAEITTVWTKNGIPLDDKATK